MATFVRTRRTRAVVEVTIDRPDRHNSLVPPLLDDLDDALAEATGDPATRAVVLRSTGSSFSTGGDVREIYDHRDDLAAYADRLVGGLNDVVVRLVEAPIPVVVAVDGIVTGGSVGLLLGGDLVFLAPEATITPYYATVGFSPDGGWTALMPAVIGRRRTAEVLATDRTIHPDEAVVWGLASAVVQDVDGRARAAADAIAAHRSGAVGHAMALLGPDPEAVADDLDRERRRFVEQVRTEEALAGMRAFLDE